MEVGDLVKLRDSFDVHLYDQLAPTGIVVQRSSDFFIKLHNMERKVLQKYYEVISESR